MYNLIESVSISCDNCGKTFTSSGTGFSVFVSETDAHDAADADNWYSCDGKHYCRSCYTYDEDDNLVVRSFSPVYEVIADYPNNKDFPIGKKINFELWNGSASYWVHIVEDCQGKREYLSHYFDTYPHLFRKLK